MSKIIIGIDPDSKAQGVAIYLNGELIGCEAMTLLSIYFMLIEWVNGAKNIDINDVTIHMEDVCANNSVFMKPGRMDKKREGEAKARGRTLGMCQQAQSELERVFEYFGVKVVKHKISKIWKKDKRQFELVTGWASQSNEDTRSAAYFGYLGLKR